MQSITARIATTHTPRVFASTTRVLRSNTLRDAAKPFVRSFTSSSRTRPPATPVRVRAYSGATAPRRSMSTATGGNRPPTGHMTQNASGRVRSASTSGTSNHRTPPSQGPGFLATMGTALNALANLFGLGSGSASPTVSAERARQITAYLPDQGHLPAERQRSPVDTYRSYETSARRLANEIGVPAALANQFPPETELAMTMYQQAPTEGGSADDTQAPYPFTGRDFNQALRGDTPLTPGAGRSRDTPDTPKEKLIAGLELRVLAVPVTPADKHGVYARTLATNDHNAELLRTLDMEEIGPDSEAKPVPVTDAGVLSVTDKLAALAPSMYVISVDDAFVFPHSKNNDLARAEGEHMAVGQVLVKIGEHRGVPVVAAYSDMAVHADALADIDRHFSFEGDALATAIGTEARGERVDNAKAEITHRHAELLARVVQQVDDAHRAQPSTL
ncbi:hypothetical protein [Achromobacter sp. UMC71]|uniref:hypothetical protein n=1 Tax=Achromobacter sp. UMC71 TaxID=1862320 RepID=UPI0016035124|nr:hypothetical protein [Achromobacter sp. UMC71]